MCDIKDSLQSKNSLPYENHTTENEDINYKNYDFNNDSTINSPTSGYNNNLLSQFINVLDNILELFDTLNDVFDTSFGNNPTTKGSEYGYNDVFDSPTLESNPMRSSTKKSGENENDVTSSEDIQSSDAKGDAPTMEYEYVDAESGTFDTKGADYVVVIRSIGREQHTLKESDFGITGGEVEGTTGSQDKGMQLIKTTDIDTLKYDKKVQFIRIDTDGKELKIDNARENGDTFSGALDPNLGNDKNSIKKDAGSDFAIYADDESKYDDRVEKLRGAASSTFYSGDDSAYVMTSQTPADVRGNGAIMQLSWA